MFAAEKGRVKGSSLQNTKKSKAARRRKNTVKERRLLYAPGVLLQKERVMLV
jgi:hypothetical protein